MPSARRAGWNLPLLSLVASRPLHRARLALVASVIVCASVVALAVVNLWYERDEDLRHAQRDLENLGLALGEHLAQRLDNIDLALKAAVGQLQEQAVPLTSPQATRVLRAHAEALPLVPAAALYTTLGELMAASSTDPDAVPASLAETAVLPVHRSGKTHALHISRPLRMSPQGAWRLILSRPVTDAHGELRAIIAAVFDPQKLVETYRSIDLGADATVALLDRDGTLLAAYPWRHELIGKAYVEDAALKDPSSDESADGTWRRSPFDQQLVLASTTAIRDFPVSMVVMADRRTVLAGWRRHAGVGGTAAALIGILALALGVMVDRHVRRREESVAQLRENQAELTEAQRIARLGSWRIDAATGTLHWSSEAAALLGISSTAVSSIDRLLEAVSPDDRPQVERAWAKFVAGEKLDVEFRTLPLNGAVRWLHARAETALSGASGGLRARGTLLDITEERKAQQALQHLAAVVESTEDAILSIAGDGRILSWNRGATRMFGYAAEEVIGKPLAQFLPAQKAAQAMQLAARSAAGETIEGLETRLELREKGAIHIAVTLSPLRDAAGHVVAASAVARDITARREAELRRRLEHRIAQTLAESAPLASTLPRILDALCRAISLDCGLQWEVASDNSGYHLACSWCRPQWDKAAMTACLPKRIDAPQDPGKTWHTSTPHWAGSETLRLRHPWLAATGQAFRNALVIPISVGTRVICVLELLTTRERTHDPDLLASARVIQSQIAQYFERKQAEDALRAEKEYIAHVIAAAPTLIASIGKDGIARSVNPAIREIAGYLPSELEGKDLWQALRAADHSGVARLLAAAAEGGAANHQLTIRARTGEVRDLAISAAARKAPDGGVVEYILVGTDVTARRLDEARRAAEYAVARALTEEQSERKAIERILAIVCEILDWECAVYRVFDPATRQVSSPCSWSRPSAPLQALVHALETPRELAASTLYWRTIELRQPQWDNDLPTRVSPRLQPKLIEAGIRSAISVPIQTGERILGTLQFFARSNSRPESVLVDVMQAIGHQVGQFIERKRVETAQQQADERLRNIAANIPGIVFEYRLRPDGTAAFEFVSERSVDMLEERPQTLMSDPRTMFRLVEPAYRRQLLRSMRVSRNSRSLWLAEMPIRTASGRIRWVRGQSMPEYLSDGSVVWDGVIVDVTAQKQAEQAIQQMNEQLERRVVERTAQLSAANRELESFAYSVSHDLRAPLRSIDGFSRILTEEYAHALEPTAADYLSRVRNASQRMGKLIDDLLSLSRVTRSELKRVRTDLSALAEAILQELRSEAPERAVDVSIHPGMYCLADPSLLRIALYNLLGNAWKFTSKRASATIEFGALTQRNKTVYYVRDNGAGFDMEHAGKLFGAFQRLHSPREFEGTGVGLATVSRIIDRHGGMVWAESVLDKGTTFYFTLGAGGARP